MNSESDKKEQEESPHRIMLVEDDNILAMAMKAMLKKMGYEVISVEKTGMGAISKATEMKPDIMLVDIYLKDDTTGIEVVEELQDKINTVFIYVTGNTDSDHLNQAKNTRHMDYLVKPVSYHIIRDTLARVKKSA